MEKQLSVTKSRPVPTPRKSLAKSDSADKPDHNEPVCSDNVFRTVSEEIEVRQNEENERKLKSVCNKKYEGFLQKDSLDVIIPNCMELSAGEGDGYLPMGEPANDGLSDREDRPVLLHNPPKSHSVHDFKDEDTYISPSITCSVSKQQTSEALSLGSQKPVPSRTAPRPPKATESRGVYSFDDNMKAQRNSSGMKLKERPKSTVWYNEDSTTDELDRSIPILPDSSVVPDSDIKLPTKKQKTSYRPSVIGSHIIDTIKSWKSPSKSEKCKSSEKLNRTSKFYCDVQDDKSNVQDKVEDKEPEQNDTDPPPLPPPRQSVYVEASTTQITTPPVPAPRLSRLSPLAAQSASNETPPLPPRRSKRSSELLGKESSKFLSKESLDIVDERNEDASTSTRYSAGEHSNSTSVNNVDCAGYFDLSQQVLHDKSMHPDSPAGKASSSVPKICYANLTVDNEPFSDLDVIIPPSGEVLPSSSSGDGVIDDLSCDRDDNPVYITELPSQKELISADIDLDVVVYEDNDSDDSDSEYFEGYMEPNELDKSNDKIPAFEEKIASEKLLVVPTSYAPALPPRPRSPSPAKSMRKAPLASINSQSCDENSETDYFNFIQKHQRMSKRFSCGVTKESNGNKKDNASDLEKSCDIPLECDTECTNQNDSCDTDLHKINSNVISEPAKEDKEGTESVLSISNKTKMSRGLSLSDSMFSNHARCASLSSIDSDDSGDEVETPLGHDATGDITNNTHRSRRGGSTLKPKRKLVVNSKSSDSSSDDLSETVKPMKITSEAQASTAADSMGFILGTPPRVILRRKPVTSMGSSEGDSRPTSWASVSSTGSDLPHMAQLYLAEHQQGSGLIGDMSVRSSMSSLEASGEEDEVDAEKARMMKKRKKQFYVAQEMMTSERSFLDILKLLNVDYRRVIAKSSEAIKAPVVPPNVLNQLLRHLPEIQKFSETLLHDLTERVQKWDKNPKVADIFVKMGAFLKLYTAYIMDFESKCNLLDENRKKYLEFDKCTTVFEASSRCNKMSLQHFMLKPVQRLPQYRLLLRDYQKCLSKDSADYKDTETALAIVTEVAEHANQSMKYGENLNKLLEIQNGLVGRFEVIKPGRYLVKEGELMKQSRKETQPRHFFLLNDVLLYTTPYSAPYAVSNYRLNNAIPLLGMKVKVPDKEDFQNEFSIISKQRSFTICAKSPEEKDEWLKVLRETIAENDAKKKSFIQLEAEPGSPESPVINSPLQKAEFRLGSQHPVWIPDSRVSMCMVCTGEFTLAFRRHHCRSCGKVVCGFCSDYKAPLEYLDFKPGRVCKDCYRKLRLEARSSLSCPDKEKVEEARGLLGKFSKSSYGIRSKLLKITETQMHRVTQIRETLGMGSWTKPQALKEVSSTDHGALVSGYLRLWKDKKWCKIWYVVKGKVLYSFKGSEDTAATSSTVLLGYECRPFLSTGRKQYAPPSEYTTRPVLSVKAQDVFFWCFTPTGIAYCPLDKETKKGSVKFFQGVSPELLFELIHKGLPNLLFATENPESRSKWMKCIREASVP